MLCPPDTAPADRRTVFFLQSSGIRSAQLHRGSDNMNVRAVVLAGGLSVLVSACVTADPWSSGYPSQRGAAVRPSYGGFAAAHYARLGYDTGYRDGYEKGRGDARSGRRDRYDPARHKWFKSASRGYKNHYGAKPAYQQVYRSGFQTGYEAAFRETYGYGGRGRPGLFGAPNLRWGS
jgi:hypothetical protein